MAKIVKNFSKFHCFSVQLKKIYQKVLNFPEIPQFSFNSPFPTGLEIPQISKKWGKISPVGNADECCVGISLV